MLSGDNYDYDDKRKAKISFPKERIAAKAPLFPYGFG